MNGSGNERTTPASRFIIKLFSGGVFLPRSSKFVFSTRANLGAPTRNQPSTARCHGDRRNYSSAAAGEHKRTDISIISGVTLCARREEKEGENAAFSHAQNARNLLQLLDARRGEQKHDKTSFLSALTLHKLWGNLKNNIASSDINELCNTKAFLTRWWMVILTLIFLSFLNSFFILKK